jgi:hypothetical protein
MSDVVDINGDVAELLVDVEAMSWRCRGDAIVMSLGRYVDIVAMSW